MTVFLANHITTIIYSIWLVLAVIGLIKYAGRKIHLRISWKQLTFIAIGVHVFIGFALTALQYLVWKANAMGSIFTQVPLPKETPLPKLLEGIRFVFDQSHGYFAFYSYMHFFFSACILFALTALLTSVFAIIKKKVPDFLKQEDIWIIAFSCLVVGWPRVLVIIPGAFLLIVIQSLFQTISKKEKPLCLSTGFLLLTIPLLLIGNAMLSALNLYTLLAL